MTLFSQQVLADQIQKAVRRADGLDLKNLVDQAREKPPSQMSSPQARADRYRLLAETLGDNHQTELAFERIIAGNELQPINYLPHGVVAARPVCRLTLVNPRGYATGFLIAPGVLLTNNHVFPAASAARQAIAEFDLELDVFEKPKSPKIFGLRPDRLFITSQQLDFSIVAVEDAGQDGVSLDSYGFLPLIGSPGKVVEGEWLTIIQHPGGERKQVCIRENQLLTRTDEVLWYTTDTLAGASGSPVYNNAWQVVALHHKGVPEMKGGVIQTLDGRDYDPGRDNEAAIKWIANEGIRISRLVEELRKLAPDEALLEPVFTMTPARAQELLDGFARAFAAPAATSVTIVPSTAIDPPSSTPRIRSVMATRTITLTLDIADDGRVELRQPDGRAQESFTVEERSSAPRTAPPPEYDVPFDVDYSRAGARQGFDTGFLGKNFEVQLPVLGALEREATPLLMPKEARSPYVLDYRGYSLVMHAKRKFALYTAANIDGGNRFTLGRPHDEWRYDPRIERSAQIGSYYYANNQFDRGHLTRYEDMEYGKDVAAALQSAADTLHFTNCSPQHAKFNQGKQLWQGLELHILEQAIKANRFAAQVFTGPVLDPGDPVWDRFKDVQYPLQFWKIAVALTSGNELFAAGFMLDQSDVIAQFGIEATVEVPFTAFKTYQVPISEIERLTGLTFQSGPGSKPRSLSEADPLKAGSPARRAASRQRVGTTESTATTTILPPGYVPLGDRSDIILR